MKSRTQSRPGLSPSMTPAQFDNGYWYATELRAFAKELGISRVAGLRKNQIELEILARLRGKTAPSIARSNSGHDQPPDTNGSLTLDRKIVRYVNNPETKSFLEAEAKKMSPGMRRRTGARYRLNRWREQQIEAGRAITYRDLVKEYVRLSDPSVQYERAPSGRYINFLSDFLAKEANATHAAARAAWHVLKTMDCPKTYAAWKRNR